MSLPITFANLNSPIQLSYLDQDFQYLYGLISGSFNGSYGEVVYGPPNYATDTTGATDQAPLLTTFQTNVYTNNRMALDAYFDYSSEAFIPFGRYLLNSDWTVPQRLESQGEFTGAGRVKINYSYSRIKNIAAQGGVYISGGNNPKVEGIWAGNNFITVDGGGVGLEWGDFSQIISSDIKINLGNSYVNHNLFRSSHGGSITISDAGGASPGGAHANMFFMTDFTSTTGLCNISTTLNHTNLVIGAYYEAADLSPPAAITLSATSGASITVTATANIFTPTSVGGLLMVGVNGVSGKAVIKTYTDQTHVIASTAAADIPDGTAFASTSYASGAYHILGIPNIYGNFHCLGWQGDALTPPLVGKNNWAIFSNDIAERNKGDFMPFTGRNLLAGGDWDVLSLDSGSGLYWPACVVGFGFRTPSMVTDTTEPSGAGQGVQFVLTGGHAAGSGSAGFAIIVPPAPSTSNGNNTATTDVVVCFYYKGTDAEVITVSRPDSTTTSYTTSNVSVDGTWKLYRICFKAAASGNTQITFDYSVNGGTVVVGGLFGTNEKAARLPAKPSNLNGITPTSNGRGVQILDQVVQQGSVNQTATNAVSNLVNIPVTFRQPFSVAPNSASGGFVGFTIEPTDSTNILNTRGQWIQSGSITTTGFTAVIYTSSPTSTWQGRIYWTATGPK